MANAVQTMKNMQQGAENAAKNGQEVAKAFEEKGVGAFFDENNMQKMYMMSMMGGKENAASRKILGFMQTTMMADYFSGLLLNKPLQEVVGMIGTQDGVDLAQERMNVAIDRLSGITGFTAGTVTKLMNFLTNKAADGADALNKDGGKELVGQFSDIMRGAVGEDRSTIVVDKVKAFWETLKFDVAKANVANEGQRAPSEAVDNRTEEQKALDEKKATLKAINQKIEGYSLDTDIDKANQLLEKLEREAAAKEAAKAIKVEGATAEKVAANTPATGEGKQNTPNAKQPEPAKTEEVGDEGSVATSQRASSHAHHSR